MNQDKLLSRNSNKKDCQSGFTFIELVIVLAVIAILAAFTIPQLLEAQRSIRTAAVPRTLFTELRYARQQAMSQQAQINFVYDNDDKSVRIFGGTFFGPRNDPRNKTTYLGGNGLDRNEIVYANPSGLPLVLDDGTTETPLDGNGDLVLTFYPDGTLRDPLNGNNTVDVALFLHNSKKPTHTASAVSVLGAGGRVKLWRYNLNASKYVAD